ncbi:MAG: ThiF family adenylyltransferase [Clostridiales bacterium]|nr:ThiF family adenylyltransferase [Clostridiales bacterium]
MVAERYKHNLGAFTESELEVVAGSSVCVVGCGGLGGYVCHALARFGVGRLTLVDGDSYCESNLNRQLFARTDTLGRNKAEVCAEELYRINPDVSVAAVGEFLTDANAAWILAGHDLVVDCLDSFADRILLEACCECLGLPFVHGAISGFFGHVALVFPGDGVMRKLYGGRKAAEQQSSPVFSVQAVAALQCGEAVKYLAGRACHLRGKILHLNLEDLELLVLGV